MIWCSHYFSYITACWMSNIIVGVKKVFQKNYAIKLHTNTTDILGTVEQSIVSGSCCQ